MHTPKRVPLKGVRYIAAGSAHTLAVTDDSCYSWGHGQYGALGHGRWQLLRPRGCGGGGGCWCSVWQRWLCQSSVKGRGCTEPGALCRMCAAAGAAVTAGAGCCWRVVCAGTYEDRAVPTRIKALVGKDIERVAGGQHHTIFLRRDGVVYGCGSCKLGQVSNTPSCCGGSSSPWMGVVGWL